MHSLIYAAGCPLKIQQFPINDDIIRMLSSDAYYRKDLDLNSIMMFPFPAKFCVLIVIIIVAICNMTTFLYTKILFIRMQ
jgi:hypothetical protein